MDNKISSNVTFILKFSPVFIIIPPLLIIIIAIITGEKVIIAFSFSVIFIIFSAPFLWLSINLKYVYIKDDQFIITNYFKKINILITEIDNIQKRDFAIVLILKNGTAFGKEIHFYPRCRLNYRPDQLISDLKVFIDSYDKT